MLQINKHKEGSYILNELFFLKLEYFSILWCHILNPCVPDKIIHLKLDVGPTTWMKMLQITWGHNPLTKKICSRLRCI